MTLGNELLTNPKLQKIKKDLLDLVLEYQSKIFGIAPPNEKLSAAYLEEIQALEALRGQKLFFPYLGSGLGRGSYVELADGSIKLDFIAGIGPHFAGHSAHYVIEASITAALEDVIMQGNLQQNEESLLLMKRLSSLSGFEHCFLSTSGAMANENALKIAFQKRAGSNRILAFERCFAGRTIVLSHVTDKPAFRQGIPDALEVDYLPFFDPEKPQESTDKAILALQKHLSRHPGKHGAILLELIQGEGGFYVGSTSFFKALSEILVKEGVPIIADEVQTFGRTPSLFAFQYFDLAPYIDICTIGKASQVAATLYKKEIAPKKGLLSQTFTASTSAIRAASTLLDQMEKASLFGSTGRNSQIFHSFEKGFERLQKKFPERIHGPFGLGAMWAFTLKEGNGDETNRLCHRLFENGLITFTAGDKPTRLRMLPPALVVTDEEIEQALSILEETLYEFV